MVLSLCPIAFRVKNWLYVLYSKVATCSIKRMTVIPHRKLSEIFKKDILQNSCQNISVVESALNKITGIGFRAFTGKKFPSRRFAFGYIGISALPQSGLTWTSLLIKLQAFRCRAQLVKPLQRKLFENVFKRASFLNIFQKESVMKSLTFAIDLQSVHSRFANLVK